MHADYDFEVADNLSERGSVSAWWRLLSLLRGRRREGNWTCDMKTFRNEYTEHWRRGPMTFWVHVEADGRHWREAKESNPPAPRPVPGKGYPYYFVEVDGFTFEFASLDEMDVCIETLSQKLLPSTQRETNARGTGPSPHWLNRLPAGTHSWRYRKKAVGVLREARERFAAALRPD